MQSQNELRNLLQRIDHKSYPAYKDTRGSYDFGNYVLSIDHVQGDPFAAPSKVSVHVRGGAAKFPADLYRMKCRRLAVCDYLLRQFGRELERVSFKAKGSGKSGLLAVSRPGQEVLERTACQMDEAKGDLVLRFEVGFPANGRTVNARELEKIFFTFLPECVLHSLFYKALDEKAVYRAADLAEDQQYIRDHLKEQGLVAFVADASILPRESGVSGRPMKDAVKFTAPESMKVSFVLPHAGKIQGMGIKKGITLIVGGGYHGKSTLLKALELGVYNHIAGDGREYVITDDTAVKIRAEDGRSIKKVDISMFINDLPNGKDTSAFRTEDASGSTSQAANVVEAMEAGAETFLIDEDTSATNFMIRDELMQRVVNREDEPITPFIDRIRELYEQYGISTILVAGAAGSRIQGRCPHEVKDNGTRRHLHQPRYDRCALCGAAGGYGTARGARLLFKVCRTPCVQRKTHLKGERFPIDAVCGGARTCRGDGEQLCAVRAGNAEGTGDFCMHQPLQKNQFVGKGTGERE